MGRPTPTTVKEKTEDGGVKSPLQRRLRWSWRGGGQGFELGEAGGQVLNLRLLPSDGALLLLDKVPLFFVRSLVLFDQLALFWTSLRSMALTKW